ncbi:MAG TPA: hypothetical protein VJM10_01500 [Candidatus Methylomirabilis sp.]|nr:hypothetical protein [Candidatus Methylomirabilis sp.]
MRAVTVEREHLDFQGDLPEDRIAGRIEKRVGQELRRRKPVNDAMVAIDRDNPHPKGVSTEGLLPVAMWTPKKPTPATSNSRRG